MRQHRPPPIPRWLCAGASLRGRPVRRPGAPARESGLRDARRPRHGHKPITHPARPRLHIHQPARSLTMTIQACSPPAGYVDMPGDCWDDSRFPDAALVHPGADFQERGHCRGGEIPCQLTEGGRKVWRCQTDHFGILCRSSDALATWDYDCSGSVEVQRGSNCFGGCGGACVCSGGAPGPTTSYSSSECGQVVSQVVGCGLSCTTTRGDLPLRCR